MLKVGGQHPDREWGEILRERWVVNIRIVNGERFWELIRIMMDSWGESGP